MDSLLFQEGLAPLLSLVFAIASPLFLNFSLILKISEESRRASPHHGVPTNGILWRDRMKFLTFNSDK